MELNKEYKQIFLHNDSDYDRLKGKVIDKVAFTNVGEYNTHMCIIIFTDKTFIALGAKYNDDLKDYEDEPQLGNKIIIHPQNWNNGNFNLFMYITNDNKIIYSPYIRILRDLDIWQFTDEEELAIIEKNKKDRADYEYQQYLKLKAKFEKMEINIFDKNFDITKLTKVGDLVAAFIMNLYESSAKHNGENFYILKGDLDVYLKDSDDWLPTMLNEIFGLTKLDLTEFEFDNSDPYAKIYDKTVSGKYANAKYVHVGKLRKFLNEKYKEYDK